MRQLHQSKTGELNESSWGKGRNENGTSIYIWRYFILPVYTQKWELMFETHEKALLNNRLNGNQIRKQTPNYLLLKRFYAHLATHLTIVTPPAFRWSLPSTQHDGIST